MELFGMVIDTGNLIELVVILVGFIVAWVKLNQKTKVNSKEITQINNRITNVVGDCKLCKSQIIVKVDKYQQNVFNQIAQIKKELSILNATIARLQGILTTFMQQKINK